jgi:tRNA (cmo5U34)-methyltransferase
MNTTFQRADVALDFVTQRRRGIPYGEDQLQLLLRVVSHYRLNPRRIVDLGCGDGIVGRTLLAAYPTASAVLIDHSGPMLDQARTAMAAYDDVAFVDADLADPIAGVPGLRGADVIASAFAIHHLSHERKKSLYAEIFDLLAPGGVFVNIEHVKPPSQREEDLWDAVCIENLVASTGKPEAQVAAGYHGRADKADNILESVDVQMSWLTEIGFTDVDCYFKFLEIAMFGGVKPA